MIEQALIQVDAKGEFPNSALFAAYLGFRQRGCDVIKANPAQIADTEARPECLVFGGTEVVREYLGRLDIDPPNLDYPEALRPFMGRDFEITTLGEVRKRYNEPGPVVFIKPVEHKLFTGHVVGQFRDLIETAGVPSDTPVYKVKYVALESEWRLYIRGGSINGINHYKGEPLQFPDAKVIQKAVRAFQGNGAPRAYALDVGVTENWDTVLVEVNDMISLGSYGLDPSHYSFLIEMRWKELTEHLVE